MGCIVVVEGARAPDGTLDAVEGARCRALGRWLSNSEIGSEADYLCRLFFLNVATGELRHALSVGGSNATEANDPATIPEQLRIIEPIDVDQLPLVALSAASPLFDTRLQRYGLRYDDVKRGLTDAYVARIVLEANARRGAVPFHLAASGDVVSRAQRVQIPPDRALALPVARSRADLELHALEEYAARRAGSGESLVWKDIDVLEEPSAHPDVEYLVSVLRLRHRRLSARVVHTDDGLTIYDTGTHHRHSFLPDKALRDLLLDVAWRDFYSSSTLEPSTSDGRACDYAPFRSASGFIAAAKRLKRLTRASRGFWPPRYVFRRIRCWGLTLWVGGDADLALSASI